MGFNESYFGTPPWDIGRPQPEFVSLAESGEIKGDVLDVGCGTGEHAIYFASKGHRVLGVDLSPRAIEKAKAKAEARKSDARFSVEDALALRHLGKKFDTAIDCGLFHTFPDDERPIYLDSIASVLRKGGRFFVMCFSDREPGDWGPRRVSESELLKAFSSGWRLDYVRRAGFETFTPGGTVDANLAAATVL